LHNFITNYVIGDKLYLNITNRCTNNCAFCIRKTDRGVGYDLWLDREPDAGEVIAGLSGLDKYGEVVFCGYGEPTVRLDVVVRVASYLRCVFKGTIRINTNGHADLIHGPGSAEKLSGFIDVVNISLNAHNSAKYVEICQPVFGEQAYDAVIDFARSCIKVIPSVILSVVDWPGVDVEACKKTAQSLGAGFRLRSCQL